MFNNYAPNLDTMQKYLQDESNNSGGSDIKWWSIPKGSSAIRILPPWDPTGRVALPVFSHPIEFQGKDMGYKKYTWTCVNKTFNKPCAICEGLAGLAASGVDISNWEARQRKYYFNAIVLQDPSNQVAPGTHVLMKAPKTFYDWIISQITNPMIGDITSVDNGIDIICTREGEGLGTSYNMTLSPNGRTPINKEYLDKITDLYNLDDIFSTGFEQEQVNELIQSLGRSASMMNTAVTNTVAQMGGYQAPISPQPIAPTPVVPAPQVPPMQAPQQPIQTPIPPAPTAPQGFPMPVPQAPTQAPQPAVAPSINAANTPKCFGQYNPGSVNCVVCGSELQCKSAQGGN